MIPFEVPNWFIEWAIKLANCGLPWHTALSVAVAMAIGVAAVWSEE